MIEQPVNQYTYNLKRKCPCGKLIPDQWHKNFKYCAPFRDPNTGKWIRHKDIYTADDKKKKNAPYKSIANKHKRMHQGLLKLWKKKNPKDSLMEVIVSYQELEAHDIDAFAPMKYDSNEQKKYILYYVEFMLDQINSTAFKLLRHGKQF